jgi:putative transposase
MAAGGGGFWDGRFRCIAVDSGEHLLSCLAYVDMNTVGAGVVEHPADWNWSGYRELAGSGGVAEKSARARGAS